MSTNQPTTYAEWRRRLEEAAGLPLTQEFIRERIAALRDTADPMTRRFIETYGDSHRQQVIAWFQQALEEVETA